MVDASAPRDAPLVLIGAGGTAGHVVPALAVADALRADGARVVFIGGERAERELVPQAGYELLTLTVAQLARHDPVRAARAMLVAARAVASARRLVDRLRPAAVLGAGGYVAGPVGLAAASKRVPLVLMEADSHLGLTNRLLGAGGTAGLPDLPAPRPRRPPLFRHRTPRAAAGDRPRRGAEALRRRGRRSARARVRGLAGGALDQQRGARGVHRRALSRPACRRHPRSPRSHVTGPLLRPARLHLRLQRGLAGRGPRGGAIRWIDL